ncbi:MAG: hypothetical protein QM330_00445 [Acidobacteriota bacterium]|jgi:hypothetical protein|nr:hypothetical protein [Acidobacteriota bacterium]NLT32606.1 hypothetical protein [Acidobacteriota bacterium]
MKSQGHRLLDNAEGKGVIGCLVFIVLMGLAIVVGVQLAPVYYSNYNMEADVKTEASRAGARFLDDDTIIRDVYQMAKRNEIPIRREDIKVHRLAGQVIIEVTYSVPVSFILFERDFHFKIEASSFIGAL